MFTKFKKALSQILVLAILLRSVSAGCDFKFNVKKPDSGDSGTRPI